MGKRRDVCAWLYVNIAVETSDIRRSDVRQRFGFFAGRKKEMRDEEPNWGSSFLLRHLCKIFFC